MHQDCPVDGVALSEMQYLGIGARSCGRCHGCWLTDEGVRAAFARIPGGGERQDRFYERVVREGRATERACGRCAEAMLAIQHRGVEIDVCRGCGGIWFDGGELKRFLADGGRKSLSAGAMAGAAGVAALGAAGLAASASTEPGQRDSGESPLSAAADLAIDAASSGGTEMVGEIVGGAFSLLGDLFSGL